MLLEVINRYRTTQKLTPHEPLTSYINALQSGTKFPEIECDNIFNFHRYEQVLETYTKKDGTPAEYKRITRVDYVEPVKDICKRVLECGNAYLKHRTYVDNCATTFPLMKEAYDGMYIELDFSQNLALRPKDEVQSAHFSGKQFTLHCSIVDPVGYRYHFHLSDDTTHDPVFVDQVLRELIRKYDIKNQDLWIQSDNAPTQYKNKYAFFLLQRLAKEFNLRIIRTFGAAGHGKRAIDGMSSFGVKNILRKEIVTNNIFFNKSEEVIDYLSHKCPQFNYEHIPSEDVVKSRIMQKDSIIIRNCMKQHLMVFTPTVTSF